METYLPITYLNDFVFCPYSIYLHQVFDTNAEDLYSASPQQKGKASHMDIDVFEPASYETDEAILKGIYVISTRLGVYGRIDTLFVKEKRLVESKYEIKTLYRGYYYQLWCQYFALVEMGYHLEQLQFFSIKDSKYFEVPMPKTEELNELKQHIKKIAWFDFEAPLKVNPEKCKRCIYAALCDKTTHDHVYA
jgi:CRISPR-associated exonuclease Cas4